MEDKGEDRKSSGFVGKFVSGLGGLILGIAVGITVNIVSEQYTSYAPRADECHESLGHLAGAVTGVPTYIDALVRTDFYSPEDVHFAHQRWNLEVAEPYSVVTNKCPLDEGNSDYLAVEDKRRFNQAFYDLFYCSDTPCSDEEISSVVDRATDAAIPLMDRAREVKYWDFWQRFGYTWKDLF